MFKILDNVYDRSIAGVFRAIFFGTFWRLWKLVFTKKFSKAFTFMFSFYPHSEMFCNFVSGVNCSEWHNFIYIILT